MWKSAIANTAKKKEETGCNSPVLKNEGHRLPWHNGQSCAFDQIWPISVQNRKSARAKWMGVGAYFFQDALGHAIAWASRCSQRRKGETPIVAKATISLDGAADLIDNQHWKSVKLIVEKSAPLSLSQVGPIAIVDPNYEGDVSDLYNNHEDDLYLTKYVDLLEAQGFAVPAIRGAFIEDKPVHPTSWLYDESHVQICVRDPKAIQTIEWLEF